MSLINDHDLLQRTEQEVERRLMPQTKAAYKNIVAAGMEIAMSKGSGEGGMVAGLLANKDPVTAAAIGAINLVLMMAKQSKGKMPEEAMVPASHTMMLLALDFLHRVGRVKVGQSELDKATRVFANQWFAAVKVSPEMLQKMAVKTNGIIQNPEQMEKIRRRAGVAEAGGDR